MSTTRRTTRRATPASRLDSALEQEEITPMQTDPPQSPTPSITDRLGPRHEPAESTTSVFDRLGTQRLEPEPSKVASIPFSGKDADWEIFKQLAESNFQCYGLTDVIKSNVKPTTMSQDLWNHKQFVVFNRLLTDCKGTAFHLVNQAGKTSTSDFGTAAWTALTERFGSINKARKRELIEKLISLGAETAPTCFDVEEKIDEAIDYASKLNSAGAPVSDEVVAQVIKGIMPPTILHKWEVLMDQEIKLEEAVRRIRHDISVACTENQPKGAFKKRQKPEDEPTPTEEVRQVRVKPDPHHAPGAGVCLHHAGSRSRRHLGLVHARGPDRGHPRGHLPLPEPRLRRCPLPSSADF